MVHQLADTGAGLGWSFCVTFIILFIMNKIPGLSLRVDIESERAGLDQAELGMSCYEHVEDVKMNLGSNGAFGNMAFVSSFDLRQNGRKVGSHSNNIFQVEQSRM